MRVRQVRADEGERARERDAPFAHRLSPPEKHETDERERRKQRPNVRLSPGAEARGRNLRYPIPRLRRETREGVLAMDVAKLLRENDHVGRERSPRRRRVETKAGRVERH